MEGRIIAQDCPRNRRAALSLTETSSRYVHALQRTRMTHRCWSTATRLGKTARHTNLDTPGVGNLRNAYTPCISRPLPLSQRRPDLTCHDAPPSNRIRKQASNTNAVTISLIPSSTSRPRPHSAHVHCAHHPPLNACSVPQFCIFSHLIVTAACTTDIYPSLAFSDERVHMHQRLESLAVGVSARDRYFRYH